MKLTTHEGFLLQERNLNHAMDAPPYNQPINRSINLNLLMNVHLNSKQEKESLKKIYSYLQLWNGRIRGKIMLVNRTVSQRIENLK